MTFFRPGRIAALASLMLIALPGPAEARVVSYAPLTGRAAIPAVQKRTNRHALLIEQTGAFPREGGPPCRTCYWSGFARLVLYDSSGLEEPRDVTPGGADTIFDFAAAREEAGHPPVLLAHTTASLWTEPNPTGQYRFLFSADGGVSWSVLGVSTSDFGYSPDVDHGGPFAKARSSPIRIGTTETPFLVALYERDSQGVSYLVLWDVLANGIVRRRASFAIDGRFLGTDLEGRRALLLGTPVSGEGAGPRGLYVVNANGSMQMLLRSPGDPNVPWPYFDDGWITPDGRAYVGAWAPPSIDTTDRNVILLAGGTGSVVASVPFLNENAIFAVPSPDYSGAWVIQQLGGPTVLSSYTPATGLVEAWRDVSRQEVEALYAGASGKRLLVQVHRPRPQLEQVVFVDPALAVWDVGTPAPASYDELFLNEHPLKGFVHVDPDTISGGAPFLFDSGSPPLTGIIGGPSGGGGGGADVIQEWGTVRGSLKQRLVIPATARTDGLGGSRWRTDLVLRNPDPSPVAVAVRFLPNSGTAPAVPDASVTLAGNAVVTKSDVLASLFQLQSGSGALLLTPESGRSIDATSRTYTNAPSGTYGMSVGAVDVFAGVGAGLPVSFSAGLLGDGFRTNFLATDVGGRGTRASLSLSANTADPSAGVGVIASPIWGQTQVNDLGATLGAPPWKTGSLLVTPQSGEAVMGLIAIDGVTNDPTYFAPDLPATVVRTIPAIVHLNGAHGAAFRTDLFLFNPTDGWRAVSLFVKSWNTNEPEKRLEVSLFPGESKTVPDALSTLFGLTGVARLRFQTVLWAYGPADGVRVTSRTYTAGPNGGTYGLLIPALNAFQSATGGESLEILLPAGGSGFRTNLALVDLTSSFTPDASPESVTVEVFDEHGSLLDQFETSVPVAGGIQIDDLFHGRGLGDGPPAGVIRISPAGGLVAAYASVIDNGTNDPMYAAAQLASRN